MVLQFVIQEHMLVSILGDTKCGWMNRWMDGWMDRRTDGGMDGWLDGWMV